MTLIAVVLFIGLTVVSEVRGPKASDDYGRLLRQQIPAAPVANSAPQVVTEAPIPDEEHADPLLLTAAAREQYLGVDQPLTASAIAPAPAADFSRPAPVLGSGQRVTVVGDSNGIAVVTTTTQRGELGGGIFKK